MATICDRNHCIGPYHRLLADATPRKVSKRRKKLVTKKVDFPLFFFSSKEGRKGVLICLAIPLLKELEELEEQNDGTLRILMAGICTKWMSFNIQCKHMSKNSRRGRDDDDPLFDIEKQAHCLNKYFSSSLQNFQV